MSSFDWTSSQKDAITIRNKGIVVSAAAGSGKTTVLIERLSRLLLDEKNKIPAQDLVAVTFTKKAAAHMKAKLNSAIDKELVKSFASPDERESERLAWLLEQKNDLQFSKVSTINSFCLDFVKENISRFEFQGSPGILDEAVELMMFDNASQAAVEELCENDPQVYGRLCNALDCNSKGFKEILRALYVFIRTIPFREQWIQQAKKHYTDDGLVSQAITLYRNGVTEKTDRANELLNALYVLVSKISTYKQVPNFIKSITAAADALNAQLDIIRQSYSHQDFEKYLAAVCEKIRKPAFRTNKDIKAMSSDESAILCDMCTQASDIVAQINAIIDSLKADGVLTDEAIRNNLNEAAFLFDVLVDLVQTTEKNMYQAKLERNALDFSDVEMMTKDLLVEMKDGKLVRTELCEDIRKSGIYKIITIDEFQDVNNLQELIFRALSDGKDLDHMGPNTFIVGDIKQAIYRFRQTNPELFNKSVGDAKKGFDDLCLVNLQENFRSREGIIDFVNFVFSKIMYKQIGGVDYDSSQELKFAATYYPQIKQDETCVELMLVDRHDDFQMSDLNEEFYLVANRIKQILSDNSRYMVMDEDTRQMRACRPSDICVLLQTNHSVLEMTKALEAVGLKAQSQENEGYLKSSEITLVLNILRVIDNPLNDIAMASMLMSPVFGFTATEMLIMHEKREKIEGRRYNGFYTVLSNAHYSYINKLAADFEFERMFDDRPMLQKKCSQTFETLQSFIYRAMSTNLERLIRYIYDVTDLPGLTSIYLDSAKKRSNLLLFLSYARDYENSGNDGVSGFIRFVDSLYDNNKAFKGAGKATLAGECVKVMTFHSSKGLEFPYVFLCDLSNNGNNNKQNIYLHYKVGDDDPDDKDSFAFEARDIARHMIRTNILYKGIDEKSTLEDKSEKLRLFYVGCTRAKEKLFISVSPKCNGSIKASTSKQKLVKTLVGAHKCNNKTELIEHISACDNMLDYLMCALSFANLGKDFARWALDNAQDSGADLSGDEKMLDNIVCDTRKEKINITVKRIEVEQTEEKPGKQLKIKTFDPKIIDELRENYRKEEEYHRSQLDSAMLPSKLSVTEIVRLENEKESIGADRQDVDHNADGFNPDFFPNLTKLDESKSKLTAAEKGTLTHKFMELADYTLAEISVKDELSRLVRKGCFTPKEAAGVYVDSLRRFFESEFYRRIKASEEKFREKKFMVSMRDISVDERHKGITGEDGIIQGIADCVFKENDGYVIVDYKTDNFKSEADMDKYGTQLEFYKAALELVLGSECADGIIKKANIKSCYIYSFKLGKGKEFMF